MPSGGGIFRFEIKLRLNRQTAVVLCSAGYGGLHAQERLPAYTIFVPSFDE